MSMLAEKKRREKYCLNPRGKAWSDDQNKFGQKLLEKMGWSAGQGLGVNNQGPTDIVKVKKKEDSKGLGFKENGEEWLKTTSEFNELLDRLGGSSGETDEKPETLSSLEDRSKKSKARVHYHKFTRGKDLSQYSEKDLASIIGPAVIQSKSKTESTIYTSNQMYKGSSEEYFSKKKNSKENKPQCVEDSINVVEQLTGLESLEDENKDISEGLITNVDNDSSLKNSSKKKKKQVHDSCQFKTDIETTNSNTRSKNSSSTEFPSTAEYHCHENTDSLNTETILKKKKKKGINSSASVMPLDNAAIDLDVINPANNHYSVECEENVPKKNRKRKKEIKVETHEVVDVLDCEVNVLGADEIKETCTNSIPDDLVLGQKKKKRKSARMEENGNEDFISDSKAFNLNEQEQTISETNGIFKKKKKQKQTEEDLVSKTSEQRNQDSVNDFCESRSKKTKKRKHDADDDTFIEESIVNEKRKKRKGETSVESDNEVTLEEPAIVQKIKKVKKIKNNDSLYLETGSEVNILSNSNNETDGSHPQENEQVNHIDCSYIRKKKKHKKLINMNVE